MLFDLSAHDNVAMGLVGSRRTPADVTREEVMDACCLALMHDFVRDLPEGYDTKLGNGGTGLSASQRQRLAIARAWIRNPTVLIFGRFHLYCACFSILTNLADEQLQR